MALVSKVTKHISPDPSGIGGAGLEGAVAVPKILCLRRDRDKEYGDR
jgi:hypothetical protein